METPIFWEYTWTGNIRLALRRTAERWRFSRMQNRPRPPHNRSSCTVFNDRQWGLWVTKSVLFLPFLTIEYLFISRSLCQRTYLQSHARLYIPLYKIAMISQRMHVARQQVVQLAHERSVESASFTAPLSQKRSSLNIRAAQAMSESSTRRKCTTQGKHPASCKTPSDRSPAITDSLLIQRISSVFLSAVDTVANILIAFDAPNGPRKLKSDMSFNCSVKERSKLVRAPTLPNSKRHGDTKSQSSSPRSSSVKRRQRCPLERIVSAPATLPVTTIHRDESLHLPLFSRASTQTPLRSIYHPRQPKDLKRSKIPARAGTAGIRVTPSKMLPQGAAQPRRVRFAAFVQTMS